MMGKSSLQQPESGPGEVGPVRINPGNVELTSLQFERQRGGGAGGEAEAESAEAEVSFEFKARRIAADAVLVGLAVDVKAPNVAAVSAAAQTVLTVSVTEGADVNLETELAQIAARIGPVVIYPYLREVVADATRRAGLEPLTLPVYQVGNFFKVKPEDLRLPQAKPAAKRSSKAKKPVKSKRKKAGESA